MKHSPRSHAAGGMPAVVKEYWAKLTAALKRQGVSLDIFLKPLVPKGRVQNSEKTIVFVLLGLC
jgi:hypothetical protein